MPTGRIPPRVPENPHPFRRYRKPPPAVPPPATRLDTPIVDLGLSERTLKGIERLTAVVGGDGVAYVRELLDVTAAQFRAAGLTKDRVAEIRHAVLKLGCVPRADWSGRPAVTADDD